MSKPTSQCLLKCQIFWTRKKKQYSNNSIPGIQMVRILPGTRNQIWFNQIRNSHLIFKLFYLAFNFWATKTSGSKFARDTNIEEIFVGYPCSSVGFLLLILISIMDKHTLPLAGFELGTLGPKAGMLPIKLPIAWYEN